MTPSSTLQLRPHQSAGAAAVGALLLERPAARALIVMPTATGKTKLALWLAHNLGRTLWLAHTDELVEQPRADAVALFPGREVGVVKAEKNHLDAKDVVIASVQTLAQPPRLAALLVSHEQHPFKLVVPDEAHHAVRGSTYDLVLQALQGVPGIGLTATPERRDGRSIGTVFPDGVIYRYPVRVAIEQGWLVPPLPRRVVLPDFDPSTIATNGTGDLDGDKLEKALLRAHAAEATSAAAVSAVDEGRKPIVFCVSVDQSREVARLVAAAGVPSAWVAGDDAMPIAERRAALRDHRRGAVKVLVNCSVLIEGYDDPSVDCVVWGRPTKSRPLYVQAIGRGLRLDPARPASDPNGKRDCLVLDLVGAHGAYGLQTSDQVFLESEPEAPITVLKHRPSSDDVQSIGLDPETLKLRSFLLYLSGQRELDGVTVESSVRWLVAVPGRAFALQAGDGTVLVEGDGDRWRTVYEPRDQRETPVLLTVEPTTLELAQTVGENHARSTGGFRLASRDAGWRRREPTDRLRNALAAWRIDVPTNVTAGQASDLLTMRVAAARWRSRSRRQAAPAAHDGPWTDL